MDAKSPRNHGKGVTVTVYRLGCSGEVITTVYGKGVTVAL